MKIYTKKGDKGETSLIGGWRLRKCDQRVEAYGAVDEIIAALALARALCQTRGARSILTRVESELFLLGAELASLEPEKYLRQRLAADHVEQIEKEIDELQKASTLMSDFILPGPYLCSAGLHLARTIARRAEREVVRLSLEAPVREEILQYLNRLSDLLFVLAVHEEEEEVVRQVKEKVKSYGEGRGAKLLTLDQAKVILQACEAKAKEMGVPVVIAVADAGGNVVALHRMDEALLASIDIAINKAYTAVALKKETAELASLAAPGGPLHGLDSCCGGRLVIFGGGIPLWQDQKLIGGIGVSGGSVEEDIAIARAGVSALEKGVNK